MIEYEPLTMGEARALTERIKHAQVEWADAITEAFTRRADVALEYATWEEYVKAEFPALPRFDSAERPALAKLLTKDVGMSNAQAAATLGVAPRTIRRDNSTPDEVMNLIPSPTRDEREDQAVALAEQGLSLQQIAKTMGVNRRHELVRTNPRVRAARRAVDPEALPSATHEENTIACSIRPAKDLIWDIDYQLGTLLGNTYTLNSRDKIRLRTVLSARLSELENYE